MLNAEGMESALPSESGGGRRVFNGAAENVQVNTTLETLHTQRKNVSELWERQV